MMKRPNPFPFWMLTLGFAVAISFGQPATAQDDAGQAPNAEQVTEEETTAATEPEAPTAAEEPTAAVEDPQPEEPAAAAEANVDAEADAQAAAAVEAESEQLAAEAAQTESVNEGDDEPMPNSNQRALNADDAAPSPSDVGGNVPPPAPEVPSENEAAEAEADTQPVPMEGAESDVVGGSWNDAAVAADSCCGPVVDEVIYNAESASACCQPAPVGCQHAPVCCQPVPGCCVPHRPAYRSSRGFLHHWRGR